MANSPKKVKNMITLPNLTNLAKSFTDFQYPSLFSPYYWKRGPKGPVTAIGPLGTGGLSVGVVETRTIEQSNEYSYIDQKHPSIKVLSLNLGFSGENLFDDQLDYFLGKSTQSRISLKAQKSQNSQQLCALAL